MHGILLNNMSAETKRGENGPTTPQILMSQGRTLVMNMRVEAREIREKIKTSTSVESKIIKNAQAVAMERTASRIDSAIGFLGERLASFRPDPEA